MLTASFFFFCINSIIEGRNLKEHKYLFYTKMPHTDSDITLDKLNTEK